MNHDPFGNPHEFDALSEASGRYRLCLWAFRLAAIAVGLQAAVLALDVLVRFSDDKSLQHLRALVQSPQWNWWVGTPLTWGAAIASWLLIGRFRDRVWNLGALVLAAMNTFDVLLWLHEHAAEMQLSFAVPYMNDEWARRGVTVLQWFELFLLVAVAARVGAGIGRTDATQLARAAKGTAVFGLAIWIMAFYSLTSLRFGWSKRVDRRFVIEMLLMWEMTTALLALAAFQATAVCLLAARGISAHLKNLKRQHDQDDLFQTSTGAFDDRRDEVPWDK